ncbi:family 78 glycoside hydrolase catalytic domain [Streptomyces fractus]|uniref:family 78 glycoside hydrolase catalytic domain n=1 Tax=Streptomyces fractus TaxID=641806 RepID=UPI003CE67326
MESLIAPAHLSAGEQSPGRVLATATPTLSWLPPTGWKEQTSYEIEARVEDASPQRHRGNGSAPRAAWPWKPLPSRTRVVLRVRVSAGDAWSPWSAPLQVSAPLWREEDWEARWVSPQEPASDEADHGAWDIRTEFELAEVPGQARLYATALGVYKVSINGVGVGDIELAPGSTSYGDTLDAQTYEVSDALRPGTNTLAFTVSNGWYRGRNGGPQKRGVWGDTLGVRAQLEADTAPGNARILAATGSDWTARPSSVTRADLMRGQATDFRIQPEHDPGTPVLVDAVTAPTPTWSPAPPVRRVAEWQPQSVVQLRPGVSIVDAGQNISGWIRLAHLGRPGDRTRLTFGEHLDTTGDLTTEHLDMTAADGRKVIFSQVDEVTAATGTDVFEPQHTVHGFRYVRVEHLGRTLTPHDITVVAVHSDLEQHGWFACSSPDLERLHRAAEWSFRGNIVDVPTDCPTRERSGWTGDYGVFAPVAAMLYDIDGFSRKWLQSVRDDQSDDGLPAMFSPDSERMKLDPNHPGRFAGGSAAWGDALIDVPWTLYTAYGDPQVLSESWHSMNAWADYALGCAASTRHPSRAARATEPASHEKYLWDGPFHFGEWCEPRTPGEPLATLADLMARDQGEVATAYLYRSLTRLSAAASVLGHASESERRAALADRVRDAWRTEFLKPNGHTTADSQAGYVRALAFGLIPEVLRHATADRLVELIHQNDDRLATGFLTSGLLLPVLTDTGHADVAYTLLTRRGIPSWLEMLDRGATTLWEEWEGVDEKGDASASLNHYSKGAVIQFLHGYVAGLRQHPSSVGWERFTVHPVLGGGLTSARFLHLSPRGPIEVRWTRDGTHFDLDVEVPPTAMGEITLPDGTSHLKGPGTHHFTCTTAADTGRSPAATMR